MRALGFAWKELVTLMPKPCTLNRLVLVSLRLYYLTDHFPPLAGSRRIQTRGGAGPPCQPREKLRRPMILNKNPFLWART